MYAVTLRPYTCSELICVQVYAVYNRNKIILYGAAVRLLTIIGTIVIYCFYLPVGEVR